MIYNGWECAAIVAADDSDFDTVVWLDQLTGGEYKAEDVKLELYTGDNYVTNQEYSLKLSSIDSPDKYEQLTAWSKANTEVLIWVYGMRGCVLWKEPSLIKTKRQSNSKPGSFSEFTIEAKKIGSDLDIHNSINLLHPDVRISEYATTAFNSTSCTLTKTTPNGSFTTASGNIYKTTQTVAGTYYSLIGASMKDRFPVRAGMSFYLRSLTYTSAGSDPVAKLFLIEYDNADIVQVTNAVTGLGGSVLESISGAVTVSDTDTVYCRFGFGGSTISGTTGVNEFDYLQISYKSKVEAFING